MGRGEFSSRRPLSVLCVVGYRDGDYADPHTSEESPRIMTRRRGRRVQRLAPLRPSSGWWRRRGGANGEQQKRRQAVSERPLRRCATVRIAGGRQLRQRQRSQRDATPSPWPRLKTAHAFGASLARSTSHLHPRIAPIAPSRAQLQKPPSLSLSLQYSTSGPTRAMHKR